MRGFALVLAALVLGSCTQRGEPEPTPDAVAVPNLVGVSMKEARVLLIDVGLELGEVSVVTGTYTDAAIIEQDPPAGTEVDTGVAIDVVTGPAASFHWPDELEESPDLSFPSATDAVTFLSKHMDGDIALPTWVPSNVHLDTTTSVFLATRDGIRSAQVKLSTERGDIWGIQYGVSGLDGCAPEHSVPVKVSGQPGRLRVTADPDGSSRKWVELVWPATLKHPNGLFGLFGWLSPRAVLRMAESMRRVSSPPVLATLGC